MAKPLVIVESPAKAKTLGRFLGTGYTVEASFGHVRDLPESAKEVPKDIDKEVGHARRRRRRRLHARLRRPGRQEEARHARCKAALKDASELLLATDPDREGESISWHLREVLKPEGARPPHRLPRDHRGGGQGGARAARTASTRPWCARRKPAASSTGSTATRCRRCSGRRCRPGSAPAACRAWPSG